MVGLHKIPFFFISCLLLKSIFYQTQK